MKYVMKQKVWSLADNYSIQDASGADRFIVSGKVFSLGDKLSFQDTLGNELIFIREKLLSWGPSYELHRSAGEASALVRKKLWTFLKDRFTVDVTANGATPDDLEVQGDFWDHEYQFTRVGGLVASVSKKWFSWSDTYGVDVENDEDDVLILACTVVIDLCIESERRRQS